jgi:hypothetical protein
MSDDELKKIKKYFNENFEKKFIIINIAEITLLILFAQKLNKGLCFYVNYRKLNNLIKKNQYSLLLIDEILAKLKHMK